MLSMARHCFRTKKEVLRLLFKVVNVREEARPENQK